MNLTPEQIAELRRRITSGNSIPVEYARVSAEELSALLDAAEREAKLRAFAVDVMACWPHGDVDGGDLQEIAEKHGLLRPETRNQPCDEEPNRCHCLEYGGRDEFPLVCYRKTELLTETRGDAAERGRLREAPTEADVLKAVYQTGLHQDAPEGVLVERTKDGICIHEPSLSLMNFAEKIWQSALSDTKQEG